MRVAAAAMLLGLALQGGSRVTPEPKHFRFERPVVTGSTGAGPVCADLDADTYLHAKPALADVRLFAGAKEIPYALTISETAPAEDSTHVLNLQQQGAHISFDLQMPPRPYSKVNLNLQGQDFIATAKVTGLNSLGATSCCQSGTPLGSFTLFDLTSQQLWRNTTLAPAESTFPFLHVELLISAPGGNKPGSSPPEVVIQGADVPPSREAEIIYTTLAETTVLEQQGDATVATFDVPALVPVERVSFVLAPGDRTNFSRVVSVVGRSADDTGSGEESIAGRITRVKISGGIAGGGNEIRDEHLSVHAVLGLNAKRGMRVKVSVENGTSAPLPLRAVRLEMRERKLCFNAAGGPVVMFYGDEELARPVYDYARTFRISKAVAQAHLGPEQPNPTYSPRPIRQSVFARHPGLRWLALLGMIAALAGLAVKMTKRRA